MGEDGGEIVSLTILVNLSRLCAGLMVMCVFDTDIPNPQIIPVSTHNSSSLVSLPMTSILPVNWLSSRCLSLDCVRDERVDADTLYSYDIKCIHVSTYNVFRLGKL